MYILRYLLCLLVVSAFSGCNSDIFVEDTRLPVSEVTLEGDGGSATLTFQPKGLKRIYFDTYGGNSGITYYDKAGNIIPSESPASDVARINYTNLMTILDVSIDGDRITFRSTELTGTSTFSYGLNLDYGYVVESIQIEVLPGQPMELVEIDYMMDKMVVRENAKVDYSYPRYKNEGSLPARADILPYLTQQASILLSPDASWARYCGITVRIPTYVDGEWRLSDKMYDLTLESKGYYFPQGIDRMVAVPVDIPPYSEVYVSSAVSYSSAEMPFFISMRNPVSGREFWTFGKCSVLEPVSYDIQIENVQ